MTNQQRLIDTARSWLGVPYLHQGRSRLGVDCVGFVISLLDSLDSLPAGFKTPQNYGRRGDGRLAAEVERYCVPVTKASPGVLVTIRWSRDSEPTHVGLCTGTTIIHCYQRAGCVVEHGYRAQWLQLTTGLYRLPGVLYE